MLDQLLRRMHHFSFVICEVALGEGSLADVLLLHDVQVLGILFMIGLLLVDEDVGAPVARVEAPVDGAVLEVGVHVTDKLLGREPPMALEAFDAGGRDTGVHLREAKCPALAKTFVVYGETETALARDDSSGWRRGGYVQKGAAETLRIRLGDEAATMGNAGKDPMVLEHVQLVASAPRTVDTKSIALLIDLVQREVAQHRVKNLGQTEPLLAADNEAGYRLALENGLRALAAGLIGGSEDGHLLDRKWLRLNEVDVLDVRQFRLGGDQSRALQTFRRAMLVAFQHRLQVGRYLHHLSR